MTSNLRKRMPPQTPMRSATAPRYTGHEVRTLPQVRGEDARTATFRAMRKDWWPRVANRLPVPSRGFWCWQVRRA